MSNHSAAEIKQRLLQNLEGTLRHLLPDGVVHGHEYCVGSIHGEPGASLKIELRGSKAGVWKDFSDPSNETSGDILELWCAVRGQTFKEAFPDLTRWAGFNWIERPVQDRKPKPAPYDRSELASISGTPVLEYWHERGIADETLKLYRVRGHKRPSEFNEHFTAFQYIDTEGTPVMLKSTGLKLKTVQTKDRPKNVKDIWTSTPYYTLWGWWLVSPDCREIAITEGECYDAETEVLTPAGWKRFDTYVGQPVAQIDDAGAISFATPTAVVRRHYEGDMLRFCNKQVDLVVTPGHRMVVARKAPNWTIRRAEEIQSQWSIPKTGVLDGPGVLLTDDQLRLCVALSADATFDERKDSGYNQRFSPTGRYCRVQLQKPRKIERLTHLLHVLGIKVRRSRADEGQEFFGFACPKWVPGRLFPREWLTLASHRQRRLILDESRLWDGNGVPNRRQTEYSTKHLHNAEWMQAIAHTAGISATIGSRSNAIGSWYKVSLLWSKQTASITGKTVQRVPHAGTVYCVQMPTGRLLVRRNRKIAVCGNCDAMSLHQLAPGMPVLSLPAGTSNMEWIENDWDRLQMMEHIWVCTDCDGLNRAGVRPGEEAAKAIAMRLGQTRVARVPTPAAADDQVGRLGTKPGIVQAQDKGVWRFKDVNAALLHAEPDQLEITNWFEEAYFFEPKTIRPARDYRSSAFAYLQRRRRVEDQNDFIWPNVRFQYRPGELTVISGYPFGGKSTLISQTHLHEASKGEKVLLVSYEMHPNATNSELAIMLWSRMPADQAEFDRAVDWLDGKFWYLRPPEKYSFDDMLTDIAFAVQRYGITRIVIDSLFFLAPKEDWEAQDSVVRRLKNFTDLYPQVHVALVCHSAVKRDHKIVPGMSDVEGSGGLVKPIDNGITVHRNMAKSEAMKKAEEDENEDAMKKAQAMHDGTLHVWKQRLTGRVLYQKLYFIPEAKSFKTRKGDELTPILNNDPEPQPGENLF